MERAGYMMRLREAAPAGARHRRGTRRAAMVGGVFLLFGPASIGLAGHSAYDAVGYDPVVNEYLGTSHPSGVFEINIANGQPGYLNSLTGGENGGADGCVDVQEIKYVQFLVGIAVHVADSAGPSHSLSALNDPALNDIVTDLNAGPDGAPGFPVTAYFYDAAPPRSQERRPFLARARAPTVGSPSTFCSPVFIASNPLGAFGSGASVFRMSSGIWTAFPRSASPTRARCPSPREPHCSPRVFDTLAHPPLGRRRFRFNAPDDFPSRRADGGADPPQHLDGWRVFLALQTAHVLARHPHLGGKFLLRQPRRLTRSFQFRSQHRA